MPAAFLDRDGVINFDYGHVGNVLRLEYMPDALEAIKFLKSIGFFVFVVTNQAGIAKGKYSKDDYEKFMSKISEDLYDLGVQFDDVRYCPFHQDAVFEEYYHKNHPWRKPNPGMILDLQNRWNVDMNNSFLIGDKNSDLAAADAANVSGYLYLGGGSLLDFVMEIPQVRLAAGYLSL